MSEEPITGKIVLECQQCAETHARIWQLQERLKEEMERNAKTMADIRELSGLLLKEEESDSGRVFRPNSLEIISCRCLDTPKFARLLKDLKLVPEET